VQQEAERMFGLQAARLQAPVRFSAAPPSGQQQAAPGLFTRGPLTAPGQPITIRGPASTMRAGSVPSLPAPADLRKLVRAPGEPSLGDIRQHSVVENFGNR
jgi:hypothetical protein